MRLVMEKFKTIKENVTQDIEEKRSKFIANAYYVENVDEAEKIIKMVKKQYYDANHNCYAYIVKADQVVKRFSDDGEPNGTAGSPILNVLEKNKLYNVLIIVTRYFGGILLGTGGLIRAYTEAALKVVEKSNIVEQEIGYEVKVTINYQDINKFRYFCNKNNIKIVNMVYNEYVECIVEMTDEEKSNILNGNKYDERSINIIKFEIMDEKFIRK